jgi:hypothetical protein
MAFFQGSNIVTKDLQIAIDFASSRCYSGTGTQFNNLIRPRNSVGYLKNTATYSTTNRGIITTGGYNSGAVYNVGDRIDINTTAGGIDRFSGTHNFSIFFWVNQISSSGRIMSTGSAGTGTGDSDQCIWQMWCDTGQFYWWNSSGGGANNISASGTWHTPGNWEYIGFTYSYDESANNIVRCYTNGNLQFSGVTATSSHSYIDRSGESSLQWTLGGGYSSSCYNTNSSCKFGSFHLYNRTLSATEITQNYNATKKRFGL